MPALALYDVPKLYDLAFGPGPCEAFYREEARSAAGPVLELACGRERELEVIDVLSDPGRSFEELQAGGDDA